MVDIDALLVPARIVANQEAIVTCASVSRPITAHSVRRRELLARLREPGTPLGFQSRVVAGVQGSDLGGPRGRFTAWRPRTTRLSGWRRISRRSCVFPLVAADARLH
jgi:hypothetical protein